MIDPRDPVLQFFARQVRCRICAEAVPYAVLVCAVQRGYWPDYCGPKHRNTASMRRYRSRKAR